MVTTTTTYSFKKPTVGQDEDVWGGYLNDSMDLIDDVLDGTTPVTGIDINSGTIDNAVIGGTTPVAGTFTTLTATGTTTLAGASTSADITFGDNDKAIFGAGSDLQIYHDVADNNSYIKESGTGDLLILANKFIVKSASGASSFIQADPSASDVKLFYGNAEKLATTSTGIDVTGSITVSGTVDGRDVSADGAKLDGIESGATADQTKADIDALGINAATLDSLDSTQFLRSDANDTSSGTIAFGTGSLDPDSYTGYSGGFGAIADGSGWSARGVFIHGGSTGQAAALAVAGGTTYFGSQNGSAANTMSTIFSVPHSTNVVNFAQSPTVGSATIWHSGNDGSGSGLDADLWDGNQFSSYLNQAVLSSSSPNFNNLYINDYLIHTGDTDTYLGFGTNTISLVAGNSAEVTINTTGVRLGDTGNGYFQPVTGNYGSIQIDGGAHGGYEGYNIGGRAAFLHNNSTETGISDDVNNLWMARFIHGGAVELYHNGSSKLDTISSGVSINGSLFTDGSNKEDYDALSGTSPTCNTASAGAFSLTMTGLTTFTFSATDAGAGWSQGFVLQLTGNGSEVTWPTSVDWAGGTAPDAPASGETDIYVFWTRDGGTTWYGVQSIDAAA